MAVADITCEASEASDFNAYPDLYYSLKNSFRKSCAGSLNNRKECSRVLVAAVSSVTVRF